MRTWEALSIVRMLADGEDPTGGEALPDDHVLMRGRVAAALRVAVVALERELAHEERPSRRQQPGREQTGAAWSAEDDERLLSGYALGTPVATLAREHRRTIGAIRSRLKKLGVAYPDR